MPILVPLLFLLPYFVYKSYERSHRISKLMESLTQSSRDLEEMTRLLDSPSTPWTGEAPEEVQSIEKPDFTGFEVLQEMRILDLRTWNPAATGKSDGASALYGYKRLRVVKKDKNPGSRYFRLPLLPISPNAQVRFPVQQVPATVRRANVASSVPGQKECRWEASFDFEKVPVGDHVDITVELLSPGLFLKGKGDSTTLTYPIHTDAAEVTRWVLLPKGKEYRAFRIIQYQTGKLETAEEAKIVTKYLAEDSTILAYKLLSVDAGYTYEVTWYYK